MSSSATMTTASAQPEGLQLIEVTDGWAIGELELHHCVAAVWRGQPTSAALELRAKRLIELTKRYPGRCALVEVVEPTSKPPTDETRRVAMQVFRDLGTELACIGFVVEGGEMRSAVTRAIITGMLFFVKQPQPTKVFRSSDDMLRWVSPRIHSDRSRFEDEMKGALEYLRSLIKKPASPT